MADDGLDINFIFLSKNSKNVMVFQMTADEFASKTKNDLTFLPDVQKETLTDLQESGKRFYLIPKKNNWKLLEGVENLSEQEAEAFMEKLCREGIATLFPNKDEIEEYRRQIIPARDAENKRQAELRVKYDFKAPEFVAHATHVSQAEFKTSAGEIFAQYPENTDLVPAFSKGTQNEFNAEKNIKRSFDVDKLMALGQLTPYLERVFAISTKQDENGNPIFDDKGRPVPEDGSYAYSLKECCASINVVDGKIPLLIGFEDKYADFESGKKTGHIYVGRGDNFKAEYDDNGNITEYTSDKEMVVTHHYETTPKDAMEHNVQLIMFDTEENYNRWAAEVRKQRNKFDTFISSDDIMIKLLQEEIAAGRATYINATERGFNPKIKALQTGERRSFQQEQEYKPEPEKPSKAPEMRFNPTSMEFEYANPELQKLAERRRELNHTKQDILALKERIAKQGLEEIGLKGKMGQTGNSRATNPNEAVTETHKKVAKSQIEDLKPFIKNYLEQRRSK